MNLHSPHCSLGTHSRSNFQFSRYGDSLYRILPSQIAAMGYCLPAFFNAAIGAADNRASSHGTGSYFLKPSSFSKKPPK